MNFAAWLSARNTQCPRNDCRVDQLQSKAQVSKPPCLKQTVRKEDFQCNTSYLFCSVKRYWQYCGILRTGSHMQYELIMICGTHPIAVVEWTGPFRTADGKSRKITFWNTASQRFASKIQLSLSCSEAGDNQTQGIFSGGVSPIESPPSWSLPGAYHAVLLVPDQNMSFYWGFHILLAVL